LRKTTKLLKKNLQVAIDGPVAAGKSIAARMLAKKLGILYVYTGAMYRAVALLGFKNNLDLTKEDPLVELLEKSEIKLVPSKEKDKICTVLLNGQDITDELFTPRVSWGSSQVGILPKIRKILVKKQQEIAQNQPVIMEGRDITYRVLPNADLKIYMTANLDIREKRRWKDLRKKGIEKKLKEIIKETKKRDYQDSHRKTDPLKITKNAWVVNTSNMTIKEEINVVLKKLQEKGLIEIV